MHEPTFGHQLGSRACETCGKPTGADDFYFCDPCFDALPDSVIPRARRYVLTPAGVEAFRRLTQPDDPGVYARTCLRCGLDEGLGENRLCATCCPPESWVHHVLRLVDERALLLRLWRGVKRFMARCAGEGM